MAYCTVDDVQSYLIHISLSTTSQPTKEQVSNMCQHVSDNIIDPIIRSYVTLPLTDTVGLGYLSQGAIYFVLANIYRALHGMTEAVVSLEEKFTAFLEKIKTSNAVLIQPNNDMPKTVGSTAPTRKYALTGDNAEDIW